MTKHFLRIAVLVLALSSCAKSRTPPAPSAPPPPATPPIHHPAPLPSPEKKEALADLIRPTDRTLAIFRDFVLVESDIQLQEANLIEDIVSSPEIAPVKLAEIQRVLAKVHRAGAYSKNLSARVADLESRLNQRMKGLQQERWLKDGLIIAGSSVAIGILARAPVTQTWTGFRRAWGEATQDFRFSRPSAPSRELILQPREAATLGARMTMSSESLAYRGLSAFELEQDEVLALRDLERVPSSEVARTEFLPTDLAGFKYAIEDEFAGRPLGNKRVIVFEVKRFVGSPFSHYVASNEIDAPLADRIGARLSAKGIHSPRLYFFDPRRLTISPLGTSLRRFRQTLGSHLRGWPKEVLNFDWPAAAQIGLAAGAVQVLGYYEGERSGHRFGGYAVDLQPEKMVTP